MSKILQTMKLVCCFMLVIIFTMSSFAMQLSVNNHILQDPDKNRAVFETNRLIAYPANEERIQAMADILNEQVGEDLNGKFYESGVSKNSDWVKNKRDLLLGNLEKGIINGRFFYLKDTPDQLVCFVGAELSYFPNSQTAPSALVPFWGTSIKHQGQGVTSEALRGFVLADIIRDPGFTSLYVSIHPDNKGSIQLSERVLGARKVKDGLNYSKTQPRCFFEVTAECLRTISQEYSAIVWR